MLLMNNNDCANFCAAAFPNRTGVISSIVYRPFVSYRFSARYVFVVAYWKLYNPLSLSGCNLSQNVNQGPLECKKIICLKTVVTLCLNV